MPAFIYRCPNTGYRIQSFSADEQPDDGAYVPVDCVMCHQVHLVNPATGRLAGEDRE